MHHFLKHKLQSRIDNNSLRSLKPENNLIDFSSNDYLGFAQKKWTNNFCLKNGSTGSRLITGNSIFIEELECKIAQFHQAQSGLIFNSGYDANLGLLACVPQKGDTIICDELVHASIIDGARLSYANRFIFKHNDIDSLEVKLRNSKGNIFVVTESVFSMDGDTAPLKEIVNIASKYNAHLIVDEAHATGLFGENGKGLVCQDGLQDKIFARVITFGKALGCHGAIVLGSEELRLFLINFARSFIYTTALPPHALQSINQAYKSLISQNYSIEILNKITLFKKSIKLIKLSFIESESAIQCCIIPGNSNCKKAAYILQENGFDVRPILSPTVPEGRERLRICLHTFNSDDEIENLVKCLANLN